jgi:hypothetical protein
VLYKNLRKYYQPRSIKTYDVLSATMLAQSEQIHLSIYRKYRESFYTPPEAPPDTIEIPDTKLFLGFSSPSYTTGNVVAPDISIVANEGGEIVPKSRCFVVIGEKGSGKSILASIISFDNIIRKFHIPTLVIDPQGEFYMHKYSLRDKYKSPDTQDKFNDYEEKFGAKFDGYKLKVFRVGFDTSFQEEGIDADLTLTLNDFRELFNYSTSEGINSLLTILDLQESKNANVVIPFILAHPELRTFRDAINYLIGKSEYEMDVEDSIKEDVRKNGRIVVRYMESALMLGVITDKENTVDIIEEMNNNDFVVIKGKLKFGEDAKIYDKYLTYLKIYITKILIERNKYVSGVRSERMKSRLSNPLGVNILIDEADTVAPEASTNFLANLIVQLATKYRKHGISVTALTQNASLLNHVLIQQADALFISALKSQDNVHVVSERGISKETIEILRHLNKEIRNSLGLLVNEWAYINQQNDIISFYPCPPLSSFKSQ